MKMFFNLSTSRLYQVLTHHQLGHNLVLAMSHLKDNIKITYKTSLQITDNSLPLDLSQQTSECQSGNYKPITDSWHEINLKPAEGGSKRRRHIAHAGRNSLYESETAPSHHLTK